MQKYEKSIVVRVFFMLVLMTVYSTTARSECTAVYYPNVKDNLAPIIAEMLKGIESTFENTLTMVRIDQINDQAKQCPVALAIGQESAVEARKRSPKVILAAVYQAPGEKVEEATFSLFPHPEEILRRAMFYSPSMKKIHFVYNPVNASSMLGLLRNAARNQSIEIETYEATDLRAGYQQFQSAIDQAKSKSESLLLWADPSIVDTNTTLKLVVQRSWENNIVVFSNLAVFVQYGILFGVYPDNMQFGRFLGTTLRRCVEGQCPEKKIYLLEQLQTAVNKKVAQHNGIKLETHNNPYIDKVIQ